MIRCHAFVFLSTLLLMFAFPEFLPDASGASAVSSAASLPVSEAEPGVTANEETHGNPSMDFLALFIILALAKLGGDLMERVKQPSVLGELLFGVLFGNLALFGVDWPPLTRLIEFFRTDVVLHTLAELGVVLLLFQVGLESNIREMAKVGLSSFLVATLGVIAPFFLGWGVSAWFIPEANTLVHVFIGTVLCATSVGITARVLQDVGKIQTKEAKIILGAAVIDDVLGLIILAVVQGIIVADNQGKSLETFSVMMIVAKAGAFFVGSLLLGVFLSPKLFHLASYLRAKGVLLTLSLLICLFLAWLSSAFGLAPIVGAFCAGLILEETSFKQLGDYKNHDLEELISPIVAILVPVFFVRLGVMVELEYFAQLDILGFAAVLTIAAVIGKQICSLGVIDKDLDKIAVGLGMVPRGEVGLIVASIGMGLVSGGERVIAHDTYSAVVIMVMVTTLITPPILTARMRRAGSE